MLSTRIPMQLQTVDKAALRRMIAERDARTGFIRNPNATAATARQKVQEDGVVPESNSFSRDIIASRRER